jgi:hypothetical protein
MSTRALAKSVQDFDAMPPADQSESIIGFLEKMTDDLSQKNPQLATTSRITFAGKQPGKPYSEGLENVYAETWSGRGTGETGESGPVENAGGVHRQNPRESGSAGRSQRERVACADRILRLAQTASSSSAPRQATASPGDYP